MTIFPRPLRRRVWNRRRPLTAPPVSGHVCTGVAALGDGICSWQFDAVLDAPGDGHALLVNGQPPDQVQFFPGDSSLLCHYPADPAPGAPWSYAGGDSPSFLDGLPGLPGSGTCTDG